MERLLLRLLLALLKLLFQLVVFVATGSWPKLGKRAEPQKPVSGRAKQPRTKPKQARGEQTARGRRASPPRPAAGTDEPWPFEFPAELSDPESNVEGGLGSTALRAAVEARRARAKPKASALTSARGGGRSIASALRDRRTVREALVLGTALSPRPPRRPPH